MLRFVRRQVEQVEKQIEHSIRNSPLWQAKRELLESMPAIGKVNSSTLLARLPELGPRARRFVPWSAWLPMMTIVVSGTADAILLAAVRVFVRCCIWPRSVRCAVTRRCAPITNACSVAALSQRQL